jgi:peptidoglycan hydrolase-like protein with peptidoglycan-binding domain
VALGFPLPLSFPTGPAGPPDGKYGQETYTAVIAFQQREFRADPSQWDGRVGKNTLAKMDAVLPTAPAPPPPPPPLTMSALAKRDRALSILWAQAAIAGLTDTRNFIANPPPSPLLPPRLVTVTLVALETHFHFSTATIPRVEYIDKVLEIYGKDLNILNNPDTFFIDDTTSAEATKGTPAHVPFGSGKVNFTPAFQERAGTIGFGPNCRAAMVLHEPVHIADHPAASNGANHVNETSPQYANQPAMNQLHNAHSYASFGQQIFFNGVDTRFGIGKPDQ